MSPPYILDSFHFIFTNVDLTARFLSEFLSQFSSKIFNTSFNSRIPAYRAGAEGARPLHRIMVRFAWYWFWRYSAALSDDEIFRDTGQASSLDDSSFLMGVTWLHLTLDYMVHGPSAVNPVLIFQTLKPGRQMTMDNKAASLHYVTWHDMAWLLRCSAMILLLIPSLRLAS